MAELKDKEVLFNEYCCRCINKDIPETDDPCDECLQNPKNEYSHKPVNFKERDK